MKHLLFRFDFMFSSALIVLIMGCKGSEQITKTENLALTEELSSLRSNAPSENLQIDVRHITKAQFPTGNEAFIRFTMTPRYVKSDSLKTLGIEKQDLFVICDIDTTGKAVNIKMYDKPTSRSDFPYHQEMADKALEVVRSMPLWKPATRHGKRVLQKNVKVRIRVVVE